MLLDHDDLVNYSTFPEPSTIVDLPEDPRYVGETAIPT